MEFDTEELVLFLVYYNFLYILFRKYLIIGHVEISSFIYQTVFSS